MGKESVLDDFMVYPLGGSLNAKGWSQMDTVQLVPVSTN